MNIYADDSTRWSKDRKPFFQLFVIYSRTVNCLDDVESGSKILWKQFNLMSG